MHDLAVEVFFQDIFIFTWLTCVFKNIAVWAAQEAAAAAMNAFATASA